MKATFGDSEWFGLEAPSRRLKMGITQLQGMIWRYTTQNDKTCMAAKFDDTWGKSKYLLFPRTPLRVVNGDRKKTGQAVQQSNRPTKLRRIRCLRQRKW